MKLVAISDLHGFLPEDLPSCDLLLIAGDICPADNHNRAYQRHWLKERFDPWLEQQPARQIVGIAGNHDWVFEDRQSVPELSWHYLQDEERTLEGLRIYGTPWQPVFYDWAFNLTEDVLDQKFAAIPEELDILICHGPPYGYGDLVTSGPFLTGLPCGSQALLKHVERAGPRLCVFGHIHSGDHTTLTCGEGDRVTQLKNVSLLDEAYKPAYAPAVFNDF